MSNRSFISWSCQCRTTSLCSKQVNVEQMFPTWGAQCGSTSSYLCRSMCEPDAPLLSPWLRGQVTFFSLPKQSTFIPEQVDVEPPLLEPSWEEPDVAFALSHLHLHARLSKHEVITWVMAKKTPPKRLLIVAFMCTLSSSFVSFIIRKLVIDINLNIYIEISN